MIRIRTLSSRSRTLRSLLVVPIASVGLMASAAPAVADCSVNGTGVTASGGTSAVAQPPACPTLSGAPTSTDTGHKIG
jgi:hypothetical protein